ncbi:MAG: DNA modification system-associated small protein [Selenomonadaceae bacterium]|nr:DNA modification system-associated small protein [Selenomonadaceae bacterium]
MTNIEINELTSVLKTIRAKQHPEIPASLIEEIIAAEFSSQDDRTKARRDTKKVIDDYMKTVTV